MPDVSTTSPDLFLARRAAAADAEAWDEIIERYGERIYNLAYRFTGRRAEAEDLTQDIFLKLYRNLDRYRGDVPLMAWALRLSRNSCIDHYRHHRTRRQHDQGRRQLAEEQAHHQHHQANGQQQGTGKATYPDGAVYTGTFKGGLRDLRLGRRTGPGGRRLPGRRLLRSDR